MLFATKNVRVVNACVQEHCRGAGASFLCPTIVVFYDVHVVFYDVHHHMAALKYHSKRPH